MPRITKRYIDSAQLKAREFHWDEGDGALKGFGIRRKASGIASFILQYRRDGATRRMTIARVGTMTPDEAREAARKKLAEVAAGRDPSAERKAERQAETFNELVEDYQQTEKWTRKSPTANAIDQGRLNRHLLPLIGHLKVKAISQDVMEKVFRDGKTAVDQPSGKKGRRVRVTGGEGAARRTMGLAGAIFTYAQCKQKIIDKNPCRGIDCGRDGMRETIVEDAEAYARLFGALARLEAAGEITSPAANALRLIALTGARRGEITRLRWANVDLKNSRLILAPMQHKAGHRTRKPKYIALPALAAEILSQIAPGEPDDLVIRAAKDGAEIDLKKTWTRVREEAGLPADLTIYGLRHSHASHFAMSGASAVEIQAAMGHRDARTSLRYVHFAEDRKNALAERAAAVATAGFAAATRAPGGEIIEGKFGRAR
jgi:integrase